MKHILILPDGSRIGSGPGTVNAIRSVTLTRSVNDGVFLTSGSAVAAELEIALFAPGGIALTAGQEVRLLRTDDAGQERPLGVFLLEKPVRTSPNTMRLLLLCMVAASVGLLLFVTRYPFPADVDAANLEHGAKNAWKMLGCMLGVWLTYECDLRWTKFDTKAPLAGQILKLVLGFAILLAIKAGMKAPLQALFANDYLADGLRYFLMVAFAGCLWPLTFPTWAKIGKKK